MIANTARSAPKIMHVHCSQGDIGNMNDIMHMKRAISFAAKHTASFFAALNNSISDNILSLERFITASFAPNLLICPERHPTIRSNYCLSTEASVKTGVSPDKIDYRSNLSGLNRFSTDKLFKFKQLSVIKRFLPDKHKIPQLRET